MVTADELTSHGFSPCVHGGAVVSLLVGNVGVPDATDKNAPGSPQERQSDDDIAEGPMQKGAYSRYPLAPR